MFEIVIQIVDRLISLLHYKGERERAFFDELITPCFRELELIHKNYLEYFTHLLEISPEFGDELYKEKLKVLEITAKRMRTDCEAARAKIMEYIFLVHELQSERSSKNLEAFKKNRIKVSEKDNVFLFHEAVYKYFTESVQDEFGVEAYLCYDTPNTSDDQLLDSLSLWDTTYTKDESPSARMVFLLEKINYFALSEEFSTLLLTENEDVDIKRLIQVYLVTLRQKWKIICRCYANLEADFVI